MGEQCPCNDIWNCSSGFIGLLLCYSEQAWSSAESCHLLAGFVLDGVDAHVMSLNTLENLWNNRVYVANMPSHTSADIQPLDIAAFHPVKQGAFELFRQELANFGKRQKDV